MKTLHDLEEMKNEKFEPFGNKYDYFFKALENLYISKLDGISRIKYELRSWDNESQKVITNKLVDMLIEGGIMNFDPNEIYSLVE
jgi:hypothetical protein